MVKTAQQNLIGLQNILRRCLSLASQWSGMLWHGMLNDKRKKLHGHAKRWGKRIRQPQSACEVLTTRRNTALESKVNE